MPAAIRASGEIRLLVSVCRKQPLRVEGVDPRGRLRVQIDNEPPQHVGVRTVRTIQAQLSQEDGQRAGARRRRRT